MALRANPIAPRTRPAASKAIQWPESNPSRRQAPGTTRMRTAEPQASTMPTRSSIRVIGNANSSPRAKAASASLITQIEFKSNAWKQVHTLPVSTAVIFLSKLGVILVMMVLFLILFNAGMYVSGMLPSLVIAGVPPPKGSFFSLPLLRENALYFVDCLPIVAAQYLMALRSNNVLVPIGIGFMAWVAALAAVSSRLAVWWPYGYTTIHYLRDKPKGAHFATFDQLPWMGVSFFLLLTVVSYVLFATKKERG